MRFKSPRKFRTAVLLLIILTASISSPQDSNSIGTKSTITVAVPNKIDSLDPFKATVAQEFYILPLIFEYLFRYDSKSEIVPELAESWDFNKNKSELIVKLRPGHFFSDGTKLGASQVIENIQAFCRSAGPGTTPLYGLNGCSNKSLEIGIRKKDDLTIQFDISISPTAFILELTKPPFGIHIRKDDGRALGSGPYILSNFSKESIELNPNKYFGNKKVLTYSPKFRFKYIKEDQLASNIKSNQIDVAAMYLSSSIESLTSPEYQILETAPHVSQLLVLNPNIPPFDDHRVLLSIQKDIYDSNISKCSQGLVKGRGVIPIGIGGNLGEIESKQEAKNEETLHNSEKTFVLKLYRHVGRKNTCEEKILVSIFKKHKIEMSFQYLDSYDDLDKIYENPKTPAYIELFTFNTRDAAKFLSRFTPETNEPLFFFTDKAIAEILQKALKLDNIRFRFPSYKKINQMIESRASTIPLYYVGHTTTIRKCLLNREIKELKMNPNSFLFLIEGNLHPGCRG